MSPTKTPSQSAPILAITGDGAQATIRLNRVSEHNRLDPGDLNTLRSQMLRIESDAAIRVAVLTGTGAKTFCSGYTISALQDMKTQPSPEDATLEQVIGMAWVPSALGVDGGSITISDEGRSMRAEVVTRPFYDPDGEVLRS